MYVKINFDIVAKKIAKAAHAIMNERNNNKNHVLASIFANALKFTKSKDSQ